MDAANGTTWSSDSSTLSYFLSLKSLRNCVWSLINLELFTAFFSAPQRTGAVAGSAPVLDVGLEAILTSWANSSTAPHRYIQFLLGYAHCSENVALHKQCLEQLQQYGVDLALFLTLPSIAEQDDGTNTPLYNLELLTEVLQLDLNVAFERERNMPDQSQQHQQYGRFGADDSSTALMLRESNSVDATSHRQRIEHLLLSLKKVNNSLLIADAELTLLKSWRTFVQICLQKQPALLGIKHKSALGWEYIQTLAQIMVAEKRLGEGEIISVYLQHVSSLMLAFLSSSLVEGSSGTGTGAGSLASAILIGISRSQQRNNQPQMDLDEQVAGESVFRATNDLLSNVAAILHAALKAYVAPNTAHASNPMSQGIVPALVGNLSGASAARSINFDATARITQSWLAARVTTLTHVFSSPLAGATLSNTQSSPAVSFVQNLSTSTLLLMRWSNQLLMTTLSRPTASLVPPNQPTTSPLLLPAAHPGRLTSPPVRRLDGSFASPPPPTVGTSLPPVLEAQKSISNTKLIQATGQEYAATCHSLLQAISVCLAQPLLADSSITIVPLLLQAIDIVQGVAEFRERSRHAHKDEILHDQEPIEAALSLLRPMLPMLLHYFASIPLSQPLIAQKVVQLLCVIAQYEQGAEMLVQHSIMLAICTHRVFKPSAVESNASGVTGASSNGFDEGRYHPSFSPYTPSRNRDAWHQVWVLCLSLIGTLLRSTTAKSTGSIGSDSAALPPISSPTHTKLVEEVLGFFNLFSGPRLNKVMHLSHVSHLSIGSLEEIDALTHLLHEFEKCARMWHLANPALHATQKAQTLLVFTYYLRLLNDPRELERRILIVTPEEKADAEDAPEREDEEKPKSNTDFAASGSGVAITRHTSLVLEEGRGVPIERQKSEAALAAEKLLEDKRKAWKPLGGSSGMHLGGSGSSTPTRQLSTPTTPRSSSTPVHKGVSDGEEKSAEPPGSGRGGMGVNVLLTPSRGTSSLLLSSPVVHQLVRRIEQPDPSEPTIGTGFITGALAAESNHASSKSEGEREKGFAFFSQRIEFSMCLILRNCVSYLRLVSAETTTVRQALFSHKIKVVNLGSSSGPSMLPPSLSSQATQSAQAGAMWMANGLHTGAPHSAHVGLTSTERIQQMFTGLGIGIEEDAQQTALQAEFESDYYELEGSSGSSYNGGSKTFRPPLSMLVDFQQYLVRVLSRLFEIQQANGLADTLEEAARGNSSVDAFDPATMRTLLPNSAALLSSSGSAGASSAASFSLTSPSIPTLHRVMSFLLENTLLLLVQSAQLHVAQLKATQRAYLQLIMPPLAPQQPQAQTQQNIYSYGYQQEPAAAAPPPVHPGAIRVGKLLEAYRERLNHLSELLLRYLNLLSSHAPSPPSLSTSTTSSSAASRSAIVSRANRLVVHLCEIIDETTSGLARHAVAFHRFITQPQQQHQMQQQQVQGQMQMQMQPGQYAMQH